MVPTGIPHFSAKSELHEMEESKKRGKVTGGGAWGGQEETCRCSRTCSDCPDFPGPKGLCPNLSGRINGEKVGDALEDALRIPGTC